MNAILERLAKLADRIRPGTLARVKAARVSDATLQNFLLGIIGPENLPESSTEAATPASAGGSRELPLSPHRDENGLRFRFSRTPVADVPAAHSLAAEFQKLMESKAPGDHARAARLYLLDPAAFLESCQAAHRAGRLKFQQQRESEQAAVEQLRKQRGWK